MSVNYLIQTCLIALATVLVVEAVNWYYVYRKEDYVELAEQVKKYDGMVKDQKQQIQQATNDKKVNRLKGTLRANQGHLQQLQGRMMRYNMLSGFLNIAQLLGGYYLMYLLGFDGVVICQLPFVPFSFMRGLTFRGLNATELQQSAASFASSQSTSQEGSGSDQSVVDEQVYKNASVYFIFGFAIVVFRLWVQQLMEKLQLRPQLPVSTTGSIFEASSELAEQIDPNASWSEIFSGKVKTK
ncbi:hypothetical protein MP228_004645 [Amoeboaphelidium protococcarum]|nr:hypothetical protein MP228_004645 [Amoeboaphelidium protococcarum]